MARAFIIVLDSVGIGAAPDADRYGDSGANTLGHVAELCAAGEFDKRRRGPLRVPNLIGLGLAEAHRMAHGHLPPGLEGEPRPHARYGCAAELSCGKDTPSGHWEIAGVPVLFEWGNFPRTVPCFPRELIENLCREAGLSGIIGNRHASGTDIIAELGEMHLRTGEPICYTSADSVFQIAAHEGRFGLDRLYQVCAIARRLVDPLNIGRVIARPFVGASSADFRRTANRRDYAVRPPGDTILDLASAAGRDVITVGKVADIFAHSGTGRVWKADGNSAAFDRTLEAVRVLTDGGLLFANLIDFDTLYGHRRDVAGYALALEAFDERLPELLCALGHDDLLFITADHGCDPSWHGTDHTREQVLVLAYRPLSAGGPIGPRKSFADIAATVAMHLQLAQPGCGVPF